MRTATGTWFILFLVVLCTLSLTISSPAADQVAGKTFYTTVNIWYEKPERIETTNYHKGTVLPIGTKVTIKDVYDDSSRRERNALDTSVTVEPFIRFETGDKQTYKLYFLPRHAKAGTGIWDVFKQYFSENDPMAEGGAFRSLNAEEQKSVRDGKIRPGMCKAAVIMAYGYPPSHKTQTLAMGKWIYWESRFKTRAVLFKDDRVAASEGESQQDTKQSSISECIKACKENTSRTPEQCFDACNKQM